MTAYNPTAGSYGRERVSFVPTTFFAEFLAGARGPDTEHHQAHLAKHRQIRGDIAPALPSRGR
jgi:hypothetical protein